MKDMLINFVARFLISFFQGLSMLYFILILAALFAPSAHAGTPIPLVEAYPGPVLIPLFLLLLGCAIWSGAMVTERYWLRAASAGILAGVCFGGLFGTVAGVLAGTVVGMLIGMTADGDSGVAVGMLSGFIVGAIAGNLSAPQSTLPFHLWQVAIFAGGCVIVELITLGLATWWMQSNSRRLTHSRAVLVDKIPENSPNLNE